MASAVTLTCRMPHLWNGSTRNLLPKHFEGRGSLYVGQRYPSKFSLHIPSQPGETCRFQTFHPSYKKIKNLGFLQGSGVTICRGNNFETHLAAVSELYSSEKCPYRSVELVITATKHTEQGDSVRVLGPGVEGIPAKGLGRILTFDEFFLSPNTGAIPFPVDGTLLESVVYYLEESSASFNDDDDDVGDIVKPRHGIQLHLDSLFRVDPASQPLPVSGTSGPSFSQLGAITHMREAEYVPSVEWNETSSQAETIIGKNSRGGALVKVVAGDFGGLKNGPPLDDIVLLDVFMRPGSTLELPVPESYGTLVYILEGVGFFGGSLSGPMSEAAYQNEGHALWMPPLQDSFLNESIILVRSHQWSSLRFIVAAGIAPPSS